MNRNLCTKGMVLGIILLFFGAGVVPNVISSDLTFPTFGQDDVLLVPENFSSIQDAVDYAHANRPTLYEINVSDNNLIPYKENVEIEDFYNGMILTRRNNSHNPVIDAEGEGACIKIESSTEVNVTGFTLINCGSEENDAGIYFLESTNCSASFNIFDGLVPFGIYTWDKCDYINIENNIFSNCEVGIETHGYCRSTISSNNISECKWGISIFGNRASCVITYNVINNSNYVGLYMYVVDPTLLTIEHNYIHHNRINIQYRQAGFNLKRVLRIENNNIEYPDYKAIDVAFGFVIALHNYWGTYDGPWVRDARVNFIQFFGFVWPYAWSDRPWNYRR